MALLCAGALLVGGCGARSALETGSTVETAPGCPAPPAAVSTTLLGTGAILAATVDATGYPIVAGTGTGPLVLGDGASLPIDPIVDYYGDPSDGQVFLARVAPAGCSPFARAFTSAPPVAHPIAHSLNVAIDPEGRVVLTANLTSSVDFGGGPVGTIPDGSIAYYGAFAVFDAAGDHLFSGAFTSQTQVSLARAAFDAQGNIVLGGVYAGPLNLGGTSIGSSTPDPGSWGNQFLTNAFVAKLDRQGNLLWSWIDDTETMSGSDGPWTFPLSRVAAWPTGEVALSALGMLSRLDASGNVLWQAPTPSTALDAAVVASGDLLLVRTAGSSVEIDRYDPGGASVGTASAALQPTAAAFGPDGRALAVGVTTPTSSAISVAEIDPTAGEVWSRSYPSSNAILFPARGAAGARYLAGGFQGTIDLGGGTLTAAAGIDGSPTMNALVGRLSP